ncbi:type III secretion system stator protein SctL [Gluconobacter sp. NFX36]|uniref:type III secretion system stator protein SctL n=1 Tax=Gluconobacter TaxID=441 RepID=UPI003CFB5223
MTEFATLSPEQRILNPEEMTLWCEAQAAYRSALADASRLRGTARAAYDAEKQRGLEEGRAQARVEMAQQIMSSAQAASQVLQNLECSLPEIVADIVADMLGRVDISDVLPLAIEHGLSRIRRGTVAQLRIAPDCVAPLAEFMPLLQDSDSGVHIEVDAGLASGRCVLESEFGVSELGIADQTRLLRERLAAQWDQLADLADTPGHGS